MGLKAVANPPEVGLGTVTSVSVTTANGVSGSVANATTTPAITLTLGAITPTTIAGTNATDSSSSTTGAFKTAGGLGVAKAIFAGTTIQGTTLTATTQFVAPTGSAATPAITIGGTSGLHELSGSLIFDYSNTAISGLNTDGGWETLPGGGYYFRVTNMAGARDSSITRISAGLLGIGTGTQGSFAGSLSLASVLLTAGAGAGRPIATGKLSINTTAVGNITTGEDVLQTYDLPLDSFNAAGKGVHITAWGFTANNVNAKTLKLYFGSVILTNSLATSIAGVWRLEADVFSTGTDTQDYISQLVTTGAAGVALNDIEKGSLTENDGAAITIKCTGEAVDTNDIVQEGLLITFLN